MQGSGFRVYFRGVPPFPLRRARLLGGHRSHKRMPKESFSKGTMSSGPSVRKPQETTISNASALKALNSRAYKPYKP